MTTVADAFVSLRLGNAQALKAETSTALTTAGAAAGPKAGAAAAAGFSGNFRKAIVKDTAKTGESWGASLGSSMGKATGMIAKAGAATLAIIAVESIRSAANYQRGLTTLVTGAGETVKNLKLVSAGILRIAIDSGTSTTQLVEGMYQIESAGFHGAGGLKVLKAAAQGAKLSNADLGTVANAVTTVMKDYGLSGDKATNATNALISTVSRGKVHLQDLAGSLARVLPVAAALGVNMGDVGGAMATMTGEGTSARLAAMGLNATLLAMAAPSHTAQKEVAALGGSSKLVAETLTKKGLVAALTMVNDLALRAGKRGSPEYVQAMKAMLGGTNGLRVGLQLTGPHMKTLEQNTLAVSKAFVKGGSSVTGWALASKDSAQQWDKFKATLQVVGIEIGQKLIPVVQGIVGWLVKSHLILPLITAALAVMTIAILVMAGAWLASGLGLVTLALTAIVIGILFLAKNWKQVWGDIKQWTSDAVMFIRHWLSIAVDAFLLMVGTIIDGAAHAFGWIPGIGGKLKQAAKAFDTFRQNVTNSIAGIQGKTIVMGVELKAGAAAPQSGGGSSGASTGGPGLKPKINPATGKPFATGGRIYGPGGPTSDLAGIFALSNGEWVVRAASAAGYGDAAMEAVNAGRAVIHYAAGGKAGHPTGLGVSTNLPGRGAIDAFIYPLVNAVGQKMAKAMLAAMVAAAAGGAGVAGVAGSAGGSIAALMRAMSAARGWASQWGALYSVEMAEAGFNMFARNPSSGAYGLAQGITGPSWYYGEGGNPNTAAGQITGMLNYIAQRYGSPNAAWGHERAFHWYGRGGSISEPIAGIGMRSGGMYRFGESGSEVVTSERGLAQLASLLASLIRETRRSAIMTGQATAAAMGGVTRSSVAQGQASTAPGWLLG